MSRYCPEFPHAYRSWVQRGVSQREQADAQLLPLLRQGHAEGRGNYGRPRLLAWLAQRGIRCGHTRAWRLLRHAGLSLKRCRKFRPMSLTDSNHDLPLAPNRLWQQPMPERPNAVWQADITYVETDEGWLYVAGIIDRCTRRCVGWAMGDSLHTRLPLAAWQMAQTQQRPPPGLVHQGVHVPMISKKLWDEIQTALVTKGKQRKTRTKKGFQFLGFAVCGSCGYCITGERHTKKSGREYHYYRCTHKNKNQHCDDRSFVRDTVFAEEVKRNTALASIPSEWAERFLAKIETWESEGSTVKQSKLDTLKAELETVKAKIDRINKGFAGGALDIVEFKELKNPLVPIKAGLEQEIAALESSKANRLEPLRNFILEANKAYNWVRDENWLEMKSFLQKVGSNRLLRAQTLTVEFIKPAQLLAETNIAVHRTNDISEQTSKWWTRGELNPRP